MLWWRHITMRKFRDKRGGIERFETEWLAKFATFWKHFLARQAFGFLIFQTASCYTYFVSQKLRNVQHWTSTVPIHKYHTSLVLLNLTVEHRAKNKRMSPSVYLYGSSRVGGTEKARFRCNVYTTIQRCRDTCTLDESLKSCDVSPTDGIDALLHEELPVRVDKQPVQ